MGGSRPATRHDKADAMSQPNILVIVTDDVRLFRAGGHHTCYRRKCRVPKRRTSDSRTDESPQTARAMSSRVPSRRTER
jgi:hypothetical protein